MNNRFQRTLSGHLSAVRVGFSALLFVIISMALETAASRADAAVVDPGFGAHANATVDASVAPDALFTSSWPNGGLTLEWTSVIHATTNLGSSVIAYDARDRLTRYGNVYFTYDAQGRLSTRQDRGVVPYATTTYEYDLLGALRRAQLPNGDIITYGVDGAGRRIERAVNGVVSARWIYLDGLRPIAELEGSNNKVRSLFVYGTDRVPSLMIRGGITYRIVADHLGSVRRVVNTVTGQVVWSRDYDSFGNVTAQTFGTGVNAEFVPFGFAGGLKDEATGLIRFGARDYDPRIGRWTARDPLLFGGGDTNVNVYVGNDPVNFIDPTGLSFRPGNADRFHAREALDFWADLIVDPCTGSAESALYYLMGAFAALALPENAGITETTLSLGFAFGTVASPRVSTANPSRGTSLPRNLRESLGVEEAMANPGGGRALRIRMSDPRWPASDGWVKMEQIIPSGGREGPINVHYLRNTITGAVEDFKIVLPGRR